MVPVGQIYARASSRARSPPCRNNPPSGWRLGRQSFGACFPATAAGGSCNRSSLGQSVIVRQIKSVGAISPFGRIVLRPPPGRFVPGFWGEPVSSSVSIVSAYVVSYSGEMFSFGCVLLVVGQHPVSSFHHLLPPLIPWAEGPSGFCVPVRWRGVDLEMVRRPLQQMALGVFRSHWNPIAKIIKVVAVTLHT